MTKKELITIRPYLPADLGFIISTWVNGSYYGNDYFKAMDRAAFRDNYKAYITKILLRPGVIIAVSCLRENQDVILGYSVTEERENKNIVHWVYVKNDWRQIGIAKSILPKKIDIITSLTKIAKRIKKKEIIFNPFI